jgi:VanZ family protein
MATTIKTLTRIALLLAIILIIFFSIIPDPLQSNTITFLDKIKHFAAYGTLGFLFVASFINATNKLRIVLCSITFCFVIGSGLEILQFFIERSPDIIDAVSNLCGCVGGSLLAMLLSRLFLRE